MDQLLTPVDFVSYITKFTKAVVIWTLFGTKITMFYLAGQHLPFFGKSVICKCCPAGSAENRNYTSQFISDFLTEQIQHIIFPKEKITTLGCFQ